MIQQQQEGKRQQAHAFIVVGLALIIVGIAMIVYGSFDSDLFLFGVFTVYAGIVMSMLAIDNLDIIERQEMEMTTTNYGNSNP
jgi:uncharacterized membrane protein YidH (DUF202 family)